MDPIVSTDWLADRLEDPNIVIADVRWYHNKPHEARRAFLNARIPGAAFFDLDRELSDRSDPDLYRGRHPLPDPQRFAETLASKGVSRDSTVIVYDDAAGSIAARLWWMLHWIGHRAVAVLDGGITKWVAEVRPTESGPARPRDPAASTGHKPIPCEPDASMLLATKRSVTDAFASGVILLDARSPERFRGEVEPIDKHAGRIAGAANAFFAHNLTTDEIKTFRPPADLRGYYERLGITPETDVACYCGSGVSACHDILAMTLAGLPTPRLYPGSWSEWSLDPASPTATGPA